MVSELPYALDAESPLKASELQVLRAQYEKEGDMVGVQTKFNYAWGLRRRECLYYLALGNYKLGNYGEARRYNDLLLEKEPANLQASNLRQLVDDKVAKEGLMGVAIVSGVAVAAGVVGAFLMRNVRKR
ncbi:Peptidyl-prolyl cis-trans isomerase pin4 [Verticillium dahliae VDG1]|nr:Peptidyl-prolyl cis-trans isomerase pin4 [Verticillium dahliae VDG1]